MQNTLPFEPLPYTDAVGSGMTGLLRPMASRDNLFTQ